MTETKSKRCWFTFSIRDLLLMIMFAALAMGWWLDQCLISQLNRRLHTEIAVSNTNAEQLNIAWDRYRELKSVFARFTKKSEQEMLNRGMSAEEVKTVIETCLQE